MSIEGDSLSDIANDLRTFSRAIPHAVEEAVQESLDEGMFHSVDVVHVVTGRLRDSIRTDNVTQDGGDLVAGGTGGVNYAAIEEEGNSKREGHPYLRPGMEVAFRALPNKIKDKLDDELP
jgi:hypothetical protein